MVTLNPDGWNLCRNADDWADYKRLFAESKQWSPDAIAWGDGPAEYPAQVCSYSPMYLKVVSAFLYVRHAAELMLAAKPPRPFTIMPSAPLNAVGPHQDATNKHVAAMLLTVVQMMAGNSREFQRTFERKLAANLSAVDGYASGQRDAVLKAVEQADVVLPKVLPPKEE